MHQIEFLRLDDTFKYLVRLAPNAREQELRNFLGGFGLMAIWHSRQCAPSLVAKSPFSVGIIGMATAHLLPFDEPTSHLDLEMRHALTMAL